MGFSKPTLETISGDGHNFVLLEPLEFTAKNGSQYRGSTGSTTDGASTPQEVWNLMPPFGKYWLAAVLHDCAYRCTLEVLREEGWIRVQLSKPEADDLLLDAMESLGVDVLTKEVIFQAVTKFGDGAFSGDLAQPIPKVPLDPPPNPS